MDALNHTYRFKEEIICTPKIHLVANAKKVHMDNGKEWRSIDCVDYLNQDI